MSSGERPIRAAKGKQPNIEAMCPPPTSPGGPRFQSGRNEITSKRSCQIKCRCMRHIFAEGNIDLSCFSHTHSWVPHPHPPLICLWGRIGGGQGKGGRGVQHCPVVLNATGCRGNSPQQSAGPCAERCQGPRTQRRFPGTHPPSLGWHEHTHGLVAMDERLFDGLLRGGHRTAIPLGRWAPPPPPPPPRMLFLRRPDRET